MKTALIAALKSLRKLRLIRKAIELGGEKNEEINELYFIKLQL